MVIFVLSLGFRLFLFVVLELLLLEDVLNEGSVGKVMLKVVF